MSGGSFQAETKSSLDPKLQQPIARDLGQLLTGALRDPLPFMPSLGDLPQVFDPQATEQFFQDVFATPALRQLGGPGGTLSRIGAEASQRGTFFSSGRQQQQADVTAQTFAGLGQARAALVGSDLQAAQQEFQRRQPLTGQLGRQALNFLGTPLTFAFDKGPNPFVQALFSNIQTGAQIAAAGGSDIRLKDDVRYLTKGLSVNIATWVWNKLAGRLFGLKGREVGVIAQDVERVYPSLVTTIGHGYKGVYKMLVMKILALEAKGDGYGG